MKYPRLLPLSSALLRVTALPGWWAPWLGPLAVIPRIVYWEIGGDRRGDLMGGLLFWGLAFSILATTGAFMPFGAACVMGGLWVLEGVFYRRLRRFLKPEFAAPLSLFSLQWLVGEFFFGGVPSFTWGLGFADYPFFLSLASAVGENGISLLILLLGGWLWSFSRGWKSIGFLTPLLFLFAFEAGRHQKPEPVASASFAAIQPNIELGAKTASGGEVAILKQHEKMLEEALKEATRPELLFWSETMFLLPATFSGKEGEIRIPRRGLPGSPLVYPASAVRDLLKRVAAQVAEPLASGGHLLVGAHTYEPLSPDTESGVVSPRASSTLAFAKDGGLVGHAEKSELVPFGETLPFDGAFPAAEGIARWVFDSFGLSPDFVRGEEPQPLHLIREDHSVMRLGTAICWENTFERIFRKQAQAGAQAFVIFSNEAWYGLGVEMDQMLAATRFRAAETGRSVLRATNTGITILLSSTGKEIASLPRGQEGVLLGVLPLVAETYRTPYLIWGWVIGPGVALLALLGGFLAFFRGRPARKQEGNEALS